MCAARGDANHEAVCRGVGRTGGTVDPKLATAAFSSSALKEPGGCVPVATAAAWAAVPPDCIPPTARSAPRPIPWPSLPIDCVKLSSDSSARIGGGDNRAHDQNHPDRRFNPTPSARVVTMTGSSVVVSTIAGDHARRSPPIAYDRFVGLHRSNQSDRLHKRHYMASVTSISSYVMPSPLTSFMWVRFP
jgi:hypothetical protein